MTKTIITPRQKRYARNIILEGKTKKQALVDAGYGKSAQPTDIERSRGFIKLMEILGISDEALLLELREGLMAEPKAPPTWAEKVNMMRMGRMLRGHLGSDSGGDRQSRTLAFIQNFYGDRKE